jgi:hypothetical protein
MDERERRRSMSERKERKARRRRGALTCKESAGENFNTR